MLLATSPARHSGKAGQKGQTQHVKQTTMALLTFAAIVCCVCTKSKATPQAANPRTIKVMIEATELDRKTLLEKLNIHGADHKLKFVLSEKDFDYRIVFGTGQRGYQTVYGEMNSSGSSVQVFGPKGTELFAFNRAGRMTDTGATNAAAKEIIKRLRKLQ
jgi:hypothetical protein